jgi:hypothetical protein
MESTLNEKNKLRFKIDRLECQIIYDRKERDLLVTGHDNEMQKLLKHFEKEVNELKETENVDIRRFKNRISALEREAKNHKLENAALIALLPKTSFRQKPVSDIEEINKMLEYKNSKILINLNKIKQKKKQIYYI